MILKKCYLTANRCFITAEKMTDNQPVGIVVHSTGANNKTLKRYVQPLTSYADYDEIIADIGKNAYGNHWNKASKDVCVHAFIGVNKDGVVETYQTLPWHYCCWGVGRGKKGSYNYNPTAHIQFEICEDNLKDEAYFNAVFKEAAEFCAYLCKANDLTPSQICSHYECYKAGYGSGHSDCDHWLKKFGKDMNWFREQVRILLTGEEPKKIEPYSVQVLASAGLNIRKGPGTNFSKNGVLKKNTIVTIVDESEGKGADLWGKLEDGRGWISLDYTTEVESFKPYKVKVNTSAGVNIRKGAGTNYSKNGVLKNGTVVTIAGESEGKGADLWGELEDGRGWIALDYCIKI